MKTFELTFAVTSDEDIDLSQLEKDLRPYSNTDLEFLDLEMIDLNEVHVTFAVQADDIGDCPDELELLNHEDFVEDVELYSSELVSHTSY